MYFKIAVNNVRKSFKDYTIYFLTLTFAVSIFYSFNSINSQTIMADLNSNQKDYIRLLNQFIAILSIVISFILGALIIYATNFLIKRRKKEFAIYMTLGTRKRAMSLILFLENLYIGIISLVAGIILGLIFSQVLSVFTAKLFDVEMTKYSFVISYESIIKTILYFGLMFLVIIIFNIIIISKYKLIDLLYANKKNEEVKIRNIYISAFILIISMCILGTAYYLISISNLDFTESPFWLSIILGTIGTVLFFYGFSSVLIIILKRIPNIYFNDLNCFSIRQLISKFNTNFLSISVICLMLLVTIGTLSCGITIKNGMEKTLKDCTPFDATVTVIEGEDSRVDENVIKETLAKNGYDLNENDDYAVFKIFEYKDLSAGELLKNYTSDNGLKEMLESSAFERTELIPVSSFNDIMKLSGKEQINLKDDEIAISSNYTPLKDVVKNFINNNDYIEIKNRRYKLNHKEIIEDALITAPINSSLFTLIVPDELIEGVEIAEEALNINFKKDNKDANEKMLSEIFTNNKSNSEENESYLYGLTRNMCYDQNRGLSILVLFVSVYIGIVFLLSSAAVLALQQLSECNESIEGYKSIRKIGASKRMINRSIFIQVLTFFMLPLVLSIVHSYVGIRTVSNYLDALGGGDNFISILLTSAIIVIIYGGYLYATYISYKNVVNNEIENGIS